MSPPTISSRVRSGSAIGDEHEVFDVDAVRADFPDPEGARQREAAGLAGQRRDHAKATGGDRPAAVFLRARKFQHPPRGARIGGAGHGRLRSRPRKGAPFPRMPSSRQRDRLRARRHRRHQSGRAELGTPDTSKDDEIVITWLEHHANIVPWQHALREGARLRVAPVDDTGQVLLDEYEKLLGPQDASWCPFTQVSNALGTVTPVEADGRGGPRYGARVLVDGAQSVSHMPVDVQELDCDFFVFSGHKISPPPASACSTARRTLLDETAALAGRRQHDRRRDLRADRCISPPPDRFEAGTGNIADAVGLGAALDYVEQVGIERIAAYEHNAGLRDAAAPRHSRCAPDRHRRGKSRRAVVRAGRPRDRRNRHGAQRRRHCGARGPSLRAADSAALRPGGTVRPSFAFYNTSKRSTSFLARYAG